MQLVSSKPWLPYWQIARLDRPIGTLLLLWPTLWALWLASAGQPKPWLVLVFALGVLLMRSAGCVINDFADRKVDGHVKRTAQRPLPSGQLTTAQALRFFGLLVVLAFGLVLTLDVYTIVLSLAGLALAICYPFMKRITHLPQLFLGLAYSWSIPMAWMAVSGRLALETWLLFIANACWTIAYDTYYAMVDRDDDLRVGVKSTAILFGRHDLLIISLLQGAMLLILTWIGLRLQLSWPFFTALAGMLLLFASQLWSARTRDREACFAAFLHNNRVGALMFAGILASYLLTV